MAHTFAAFPDEYDLDITKRISARFQSAPMPYAQYFNVDTTALYQEKMDKYSGFGEMQTWGDGATVPLDEAVKEYDYTLTQAFYGLGFVVTRKMEQYHRFRQVQKWADSLGDSAAETLKSKTAYVLNNAFATVTYGDGVVLISASHTGAGSSTRSNILAAATALSVAGWEALQLVATQTVDYRGKSMPIKLDRCIVSPTLEPTARKLFGSPQEAFTTDNQINPHLGTQVVVEDKMTSTTAYFGQDSRKHGLTMLIGMPFTPRSYYRDANRDLVHYAEMDFVTGVEHWEGIAASAGA